MRILLIDDDELFSHLLKANLTEQRYTVDVAKDGEEGWSFLEAASYDLIVLDVMLPKLDGISFCRRLRAKGLQLLVLLLTGRGTTDDKILGLDAGADDYVVKPIPLPELEARIRALLRRKTTTGSPTLEWGNLRLDPSQCEVTYSGVVLHLTAKEYALLELFMRHTEKTHSQSSILNQLWSLEDEPPTPDTVRALIKRLRQKLKTVSADDLIETVYGLGYRLNPALQKVKQKEVISHSYRSQSYQEMNTNISEETKLKVLDQIFILEQCIENIKYSFLNVHAWETAKQESHKLISSLGIMGLFASTETAREIEILLQKPENLTQKQQDFLTEEVKKIRLLVECVTPQEIAKETIDDSVNHKNEPDIVQTRLLIVDQDQELVDSLVVAANMRGIQTAIAPHPQLALAAIRRVPPDIVLLDLVNENTQEEALILLDELSKQMPPIPVIVFHNGEQTQKKLAINRYKIKSFLRKPIASEQILAAITQALKPHSLPTEAKVLVVDDDWMTLRFLQTLLTPWGLQITTLRHPKNFWDELVQLTPDLLILDVQMPDIDGIELCQTLRNDSRWAWLPIVFLTGQRDTETIQKIFAAGGDDYVSKPIVAPELITRIFNRLERTRLLREQAEIDLLTGLPNRHRSSQDLSKFLHIAKQYQQPFCLAVLTLDNLTQINRNYGHQLGEQMLRRLTYLLRQELRSEDIISRWDSAEFIVGMYGMRRCNSVEWLAQVLEQLRQTKLQTSDSEAITITFSAGVSQYPLDGTSIQTLYQTAGLVLEKARESGGDRILPANWRPLQSQPFSLMDVILIHQDSAFAKLILQAMTTRGYHTHWLQDGKTALEILKGSNSTLHSRIILLADDLLEPKGLEILKQFKRDKITQRSKVLWLSSNLNEVEKALSLGCYDYVNIPCNIPALMNRLCQILE
ncbi:response regulator [Fortiea contorta]|uniref:response regulator n=1 Tax=Fortiea contorta TaxID=1892405 RepID=UPI000377B0B7|nr:response regulator [Fortiea contorta]